jgi:hypothetical protein
MLPRMKKAPLILLALASYDSPGGVPPDGMPPVGKRVDVNLGEGSAIGFVVGYEGDFLVLNPQFPEAHNQKSERRIRMSEIKSWGWE